MISFSLELTPVMLSSSPSKFLNSLPFLFLRTSSSPPPRLPVHFSLLLFPLRFYSFSAFFPISAFPCSCFSLLPLSSIYAFPSSWPSLFLYLFRRISLALNVVSTCLSSFDLWLLFSVLLGILVIISKQIMHTASKSQTVLLQQRLVCSKALAPGCVSCCLSVFSKAILYIRNLYAFKNLFLIAHGKANGGGIIVALSYVILSCLFEGELSESVKRRLDIVVVLERIEMVHLAFKR